MSLQSRLCRDAGQDLMQDVALNHEEVQQRLDLLATNWEELKQLADNRGRKLDDSLAYQEFLAGIEEEEAWFNEKMNLLSSDDYGDTLAAVQGLLKKHKAFETGLPVHRDRVADIRSQGEKLIEAGNHNADAISQRNESPSANWKS